MNGAHAAWDRSYSLGLRMFDNPRKYIHFLENLALGRDWVNTWASIFRVMGRVFQ